MTLHIDDRDQRSASRHSVWTCASWRCGCTHPQIPRIVRRPLLALPNFSAVAGHCE